ncbi:hypothetical protein ASE47_35455 [Ensifer sp. Root258]|nr:hypothetical protein ASE47_35455 [Ensifer sp. Root258]
MEEGASNDNEGLDEGESSDDARSEDGTPDGAGNFENINVTALRDLYETYYSVEACHSARRGQRTFYISDAEMKKAQSAFKKSRDRILARNRSIDEQEVKNSAAQQVILFARVMVSSQQRYDNRHRIGCRQIFALFPPDLNKTVAREILPPAGTPNIGGGLIIPQDPRFRN